MNEGRKIGKLNQVRRHRREHFEKTFDKYMRGEVPAEYVKQRADKLKQVKG